MKFLILSCNTGGGHNATAAAISEYFTARGQECVTLDCLDFLPQTKAKLISEGHVLLYRKAPKLFGLGYRFEEEHLPRFILSQCESYADEFCQAVRQVGCDAVINVHVFSALIMTAARRQFGLKLPGYFVATDYTCSPGVAQAEQDAYFIPHESLTEEFVQCGVPADRLVPTGIPVRPAFCTGVPQREARERLGLSPEGSLVLLACGSMGAGPMEELAQLLDQQLPAEDQLVVVCGTNEKLKRDLEKDRLSDCVSIVGFTREMDLYMDAADLILTKAGGLSTTEALMKRLPMVYINAVPGCETRNLEFMVEHGYARTADTPEALTELVCSLLQEPETLAAWRETLTQAFPTPAVERIYSYIMTDSK